MSDIESRTDDTSERSDLAGPWGSISRSFTRPPENEAVVTPAPVRAPERAPTSSLGFGRVSRGAATCRPAAAKDGHHGFVVAAYGQLPAELCVPLSDPPSLHDTLVEQDLLLPTQESTVGAATAVTRANAYGPATPSNLD